MRSMGDFVIALNCLKEANNQSSYRIVASIHLKELFDAIAASGMFNCPEVEFVDMGIKHKIFCILTNRYFFSLQSIKELKSLRSILSFLKYDNRIIYAEQKRRLKVLRLLTGAKMNAVHERGNIYESYFDFTVSDSKSFHFTYTSLQNIDSFTIFPESRMKKKEIGQQDLELLLRKIKHAGKKAVVAFFKESKLARNTNIVTHNSFSDLINLVQSAQFIITADSLPAHLAQMFHIPHIILYSRKIDTEWITPYALENIQAFRFTDIKEIEF